MIRPACAVAVGATHVEEANARIVATPVVAKDVRLPDEVERNPDKFQTLLLV